jgi:glycosyltransferase involved in cell wall biosynthesis
MNVVQLNYAFDKALTDPGALLEAYGTLTGFSEAVAAAGADRTTVVQRFHRDARIRRNGIEYTFCSASRVHQTVADAQPDVVHVNGLHFAARTWALRQRLDRSVAIVVQDHGGGVPAGRRVRVDHAIRRRMSGAVDGFLFVAAEQSEAWQRAGLLPATCRVYEVMEGSTTFRPIPRGEARAVTGIDGEPAVLWVGRLTANKDPLTVVDGFEQSLRDLPAATLTMIYDGDELLPLVRARVRSPALRDCVRLVGPVAHERLPAFYSAADLFVLGSHQEGSGYALLEACACGVLPVVTDIPSFRVITAGGSFGTLWKAGDAEACARALVNAARSNTAHARARMTAHFDGALSWRAIGRDALAAYHDALASRRARLNIDLLESSRRPVR